MKKIKQNAWKTIFPVRSVFYKAGYLCGILDSDLVAASPDIHLFSLFNQLIPELRVCDGD